MKPQKVLIVSPDYPPASGGGVGSFTFDLTIGLTNKGVTTTVVTRNVQMNDCVSREKDSTIYRLSLPKSPFRHMLFQIANASKILKIIQREKPDIIHTNGLSISFLLPLLARHFPVIVTIHGSAELLKIYFSDRYMKSTLGEKARFLAWSSLNSLPTVLDFRYCDEAVFVARHVLDECLRWKQISSVNTEVIYNGVNVRFINKSIPHSVLFNSRMICLAYVGRLVRYKGILQLLDAFAKVKKELSDSLKIRLKIFGNGPLYRKVLKKIKVLGISKEVDLKGWVPRHQLLKELSSCFLMVQPSVYEACPLSVLEAYALGKPVIAHRAAWSSEFVEQINAGLTVDTFDICNFSDILSKVITEHKIYTKLSKNARKAAETRFDVSIMVKKYLRLYERLI